MSFCDCFCHCQLGAVVSVVGSQCPWEDYESFLYSFCHYQLDAVVCGGISVSMGGIMSRFRHFFVIIKYQNALLT